MNHCIGHMVAKLKGCEQRTIEEFAVLAQEQGVRIGQVLVNNAVITERELFRELADQYGLEYLESIEGLVDEDALHELPSDFVDRCECLPLKAQSDRARLAIAEPYDLTPVLDLQVFLDMPVATVLVPLSELLRARSTYLGGNSVLARRGGHLTQQLESGIGGDESVLTLDEILKRTESEPVVRMATLIINEAVGARASDIHIEPLQHGAQVRFRVDGMLQQHGEIVRAMYVPLTSRLKILAGLDIAEKRVPQDGRIRWEAGGRQFDLRVSTLPTHHGEKTVIRILKHDVGLLDISSIGMSEEVRTQFLELLEKPQGMIFVTGPTGSGKSSTLFAALNRIRHKAINITTIENPIEYKLDGINQVQVNEKAGATFSTVLRSILRQDPDVILVGEIRDGETAQIAVQASQTGHLVFSTLHTNDALSSVTRLRDLGIPGYLIASSLLGIVAQRLVRVLCPHCKVQAPPDPEVLLRWKALLGDVPLPQAFQAVGCKACGFTGYTGRTGIYELLLMTDELRDHFIRGVPETRIRALLRQRGVKSLILNGVAKIADGVTTPQELLRVVLVEDAVQVHAADMNDE